MTLRKRVEGLSERWALGVVKATAVGMMVTVEVARIPREWLVDSRHRQALRETYDTVDS